MNKRTKIFIAGGALVAAAAAAGAGVTIAGASGDADTPPIAGTDLDKASAAALDYTGEGRVTQTELGDEESYYEVEVTLDDGSQVDVQLDEQFSVVSSESDGRDDEGPNDD